MLSTMVKMSDGGLAALSDLQNIDISFKPNEFFLASCPLSLDPYSGHPIYL